MSLDARNRIARAFVRCGWICFWMQSVLLILPVTALIYLMWTVGIRATVAVRLVNYVALAGLLIMVFTAFWSYRYTRLGTQIAASDRQPPWSSVAKTLWIGLSAALAGMCISLVLLIIDVGGLLLLLMKAPQGGVPVIQTSADDRTSWVSTINVVSLLAELCTVVGEVGLLGVSLWLLFRLTKQFGHFNSADEPPAAELP